MHPLVAVAMVVAGAAAIVRHFPPQPWEYRPAPHDRTKFHRHPGVLALAVTVGALGPVITLYVLLLGHLVVAVVLSIYLLVALVLTEAQFLR